MNRFSTAICFMFCGLCCLQAQTTPASQSIEQRMQSTEKIYRESPLSGKSKSALVAMLAFEDQVVKDASHEGGATAKYGDGYSEYVATLTEHVRQIADTDPSFPGVWAALLNAPYDPDSKFAVWLGSNGGKTVAFFFRIASGPDPGEAANALIVLARAVVYERQPGVKRHLTDEALQPLESLIRGAVGNSDTLVRMHAIQALSMIGNRSDLATLDAMAESDPGVDVPGGRPGIKGGYIFREYARQYAAKLRERLDQTH